MCGAGMWASVWRAKCKEVVRKMKDFRCVRRWAFGGFVENAPRVGLTVWRARCKELVRKIKDFRCMRRRDFGGIVENTPRVDLSMESKM